MRVIKDIFFANVSGIADDNHYLDLFVPNEKEHTLIHRDCVNSPHADTNLFANLTESGADYLASNNTDREIRNARRQWVPAENVCSEDKYDAYDPSDSDIQTAEINNVDPDLELFNSRQDSVCKTKCPLVIFVHGGGWRRGGREAWTHYLYFDVNFLLVILSLLVGTYKNVGRALANNGIACAVISYPLTEAGLVCLLAELCLSYIQSCIAVTVAILPLLGLFCFEFVLFWSHKVTFWTPIDNQNSELISGLVLIIMLVTNCITIFLLTVKKNKYKLRAHHITMLWLTLVVGSLCITYKTENRLLLTVIFTFIVNQSVILKVRLARWGGCYEDQTEVLARAVKWAKSTGHQTGVFDTSKIYLMGHSAGGHLVSLTVLDDDILAKVGCSSKDIRGVVSLSGVYDLLCLRGPFLRPFYLLPTFGHSHSTWLRASPSHVIRKKSTQQDNTTPKFLLIVAENDMFLKQQSLQFSQNLQEAEVDCRHIEVIGTNHFTIVTSLVKRFTGNEKSVLHHIMHFIHN